MNDLVDESRERAIDEDVGVARQSFLVISANLDSIFRCANKVVAWALPLDDEDISSAITIEREPKVFIWNSLCIKYRFYY